MITGDAPARDLYEWDTRDCRFCSVCFEFQLIGSPSDGRVYGDVLRDARCAVYTKLEMPNRE